MCDWYALRPARLPTSVGSFGVRLHVENLLKRNGGTSAKKYNPAQIVRLLRQIEVEIANSKDTASRPCVYLSFLPVWGPA